MNADSWADFLDRATPVGLFFLGLALLVAVVIIAGTIRVWLRERRRGVCLHCGGPLPRHPYYDVEADFWMGNQADPYCSITCLERQRGSYVHDNRPKGGDKPWLPT